jgi:hypothetical protein
MLVMQDSIKAANLTADADAYLGYVDGHWPTYDAVVARFPGKPVLSMAVFPADNAEGCDREPGDLDVGDVSEWVLRQMGRAPHSRPVVYASAANMAAVLEDLTASHIMRQDVRLLSAHYGAGKHICGPATCAEPGCPACDGTQWTDIAPGAGGSLIDESVLLDDFFAEAPMAITDGDLAAIAKAVWTADGIIPNPVDSASKTNPFWTGERVLATIAGQVLGEPAAIAASVLKGLDPASIADAIATTLGADVGQQVITALSARLAAPSV